MVHAFTSTRALIACGHLGWRDDLCSPFSTVASSQEAFIALRRRQHLSCPYDLARVCTIMLWHRHTSNSPSYTPTTHEYGGCWQCQCGTNRKLYVCLCILDNLAPHVVEEYSLAQQIVQLSSNLYRIIVYRTPVSSDAAPGTCHAHLPDRPGQNSLLVMRACIGVTPL